MVATAIVRVNSDWAVVIYLTPKVLSELLSARNNGPIRPARKALAKVLGSVIPDMYSAAAQVAACRRYERPAAINCVFNLSPPMQLR
jgi:hypothetical protein